MGAGGGEGGWGARFLGRGGFLSRIEGGVEEGGGLPFEPGRLGRWHRCSSLRGRPRLRGAALSGGGGSSFLSFVSFLAGFSRASISVAVGASAPTMRNGAQWIRPPQTSKLARMNIPLAILIIVGGLAAAAFFAGAETALTAASRARMQALETGGDKRAALANRLIARRGQLISAPCCSAASSSPSQPPPI